MDLAEFLLNYKAIMLVIAYHKFGNLDKMEQFFERHIYQNSYKEKKPILIKEVE